MNRKYVKNDHKNLNFGIFEDVEALKRLSVAQIFELNKAIDFDQLTPTIKNIALESFKIENQFKKYKINYNSVKMKLVEIDPWLSEEEFEEIDFSLNQEISKLIEKLDNIDKNIDIIRLKEIEKLIEFKSDLLVDEDFCKNHVLASKYLKKLIIDHINLEMFKKTEKFKGKIIEFKKDSPGKGKSSFMYFNSTPMESIKLTKFSHIMSPDGYKLKIENIFQTNDIFSKIININDNQVKIRVPIYYGMIVCGDSND